MFKYSFEYCRDVREAREEVSRKKIDSLTDWIKRPQIGASGLIYCKFNGSADYKSSVDKFFSTTHLEQWKERSEANNGEIIWMNEYKIIIF